ncbi:uncharacterized protein LOC107002830 isoform X2 [Solanum pennellii]|uniref:Uncharacterized protein LOC107002830 isoform X2 n=1 Tax=Solanum pennellii TaxID=28526 RepID=A0ABM1FGE3_SOLPN|nr:uncharacterized protein LOC107002830 isoform X2 [Solanum pennellii]
MCEVPFYIKKGRQLLFHLRAGNDFSVPRAMEVDTGNSCFIEKLPVERYTSTRETKKPLETNKSPAAFVNHAAIAWHESRRKWVGEASRKSERTPKDPIISPSEKSSIARDMLMSGSLDLYCTVEDNLLVNDL